MEKTFADISGAIMATSSMVRGVPGAAIDTGVSDADLIAKMASIRARRQERSSKETIEALGRVRRTRRHGRRRSPSLGARDALTLFSKTKKRTQGEV